MVSLCYCGYHLTPFWSCVHCQAPHFSEEWKHINRGLVLNAHAQHLKRFEWFCCKAREPSPWSVSWRMVPMLRHSGDPRLTLWPFFPTRPTLEKHWGPPIAVKMRWGPWKSSATSLCNESWGWIHVNIILTGTLSRAHLSWSLWGIGWCFQSGRPGI